MSTKIHKLRNKFEQHASNLTGELGMHSVDQGINVLADQASDLRPELTYVWRRRCQGRVVKVINKISIARWALSRFLEDWYNVVVDLVRVGDLQDCQRGPLFLQR